MKKLKITLLICALFAFIFSASCRQVVNLDAPRSYMTWNDYYSTEWVTIFEGFWTGMNTNYVFWDVDPTDWDLVYDTFKPRFKALGTVGDVDSDSTGESGDKVISYFREMLKDIVDGHYQVQSDHIRNSTGYTMSIDPSYERYARSFPDETALSESEVYKENPLNDDFIKSVKNLINTDYCSLVNIATGYNKTADGNAVLYFCFPGFNWSSYFWGFYNYFPDGVNDVRYKAIDEALDNYGGPSITVRQIVNESSAYNNLLDYLYTTYRYTSLELRRPTWSSAVSYRCLIDHFYYFFDQLENGQLEDGTPVVGGIVDIRGNGGGAVEDLSTLWGRIVPRDWVFAKTKYKSGENRLDHTPLMDYTIFKAPGARGVTDIPIALVVNKMSVSCSEMSALFFKSIPNGYVVGGTTWGGMGTLSGISPLIHNAGTFSVSGGMIDLVYTPFTQVLTLQGKSLEGKGITPDYPVPFVYSNMVAGQDDRLQKAIEVILENQ